MIENFSLTILGLYFAFYFILRCKAVSKQIDQAIRNEFRD